MTHAQRVVLVIALAAALAAIDHAVVGRTAFGGGGWFGYAPRTGGVYWPSGISATRLLLVRLILVIVWTLAAFRLFSSRGDE